MLRTQAHNEELTDNLENSTSRSTDEKCMEFNDRWMQWLQKDVQKLGMEFDDLRAQEKQLGGVVSAGSQAWLGSATSDVVIHSKRVDS